MIFQGMPWPAVLPIAILAMIYAINLAKKHEKTVVKDKLDGLKEKKNNH
ncbi:hypothetical protein [Roseivirga thermotolerans]|nr:hypothetical protein [Roseivirga thermotolerans]